MLPALRKLNQELAKIVEDGRVTFQEMIFDRLEEFLYAYLQTVPACVSKQNIHMMEKIVNSCRSIELQLAFMCIKVNKVML